MHEPDRPAYAQAPPRRARRVWLASILSGIAASILVTLIGAGVILLFVLLVGVSPSEGRGWVASGDDFPLLQGAAIAAMAAAFNWYFAYLTIPAASLALGLTLGRFPRRGIVRPGPYVRWAMISGAILVTGPSLLGFFAMMDADPNGLAWRLAGCVLSGAGIGALAGLACAGLFRLIVRPRAQLGEIDTRVF
jgi:hypothetical protein